MADVGGKYYCKTFLAGDKIDTWRGQLNCPKLLSGSAGSKM